MTHESIFPSGGDRVNEDMLIQNSFGDMGGGLGGFGGGDLSPRLHPKSMDAVLERYQVIKLVINVARWL